MSDTGWRSPTSTTSDGSGSVSWSNPGNTTASDDSYATSSGNLDTTDYLRASGFGFSIPFGATIDGILVSFERKQSVAGDGVGGLGEYIKIIKSNGSLSTTNRGVTSNWSTTEAYIDYGSTSDLWGETWSYSDINDADFGVALSVVIENFVDAYIDHIRIKVFYTEIPSANSDIGIYLSCKSSSTDNRNIYLDTKKYIYTWEDLHNIRSVLSGNYILANDLNSSSVGYDTYASSLANSGAGWLPLGDATTKFTGSFDGGGFTISNLYINRTTQNVGLFGYTDTLSQISNVGLVAMDITSTNNFVGSLIGNCSNATVSSCFSSGSVSGQSRVGGLIGINNSGSSVSDSYSRCSVVGDSFVGGFSGINFSLITKCYSDGFVSGNTSVGGFNGSNFGTISNSFWDTQTSGEAISSGATGKTTVQMKDINTFFTPFSTNQEVTAGDVTGVDGGTAGSGENDQQKGQSFVPTGSSISGIKLLLYIQGSASDDVVLSINSSIGGSSLGSKSVSMSGLSGSFYIPFVFDAPISVTRGNTYYMQVSRSGARDSSNKANIFFAYTTNPYSDGQMYRRDNTSWSVDSATSDWWFIIYYENGSVGLTTPWDIVENSSYVDETWKIISGASKPILGYQDYVAANNARNLMAVGGHGWYQEYFDTTTYKDVGNTTAKWVGDGIVTMQ